MRRVIVEERVPVVVVNGLLNYRFLIDIQMFFTKSAK